MADESAAAMRRFLPITGEWNYSGSVLLQLESEDLVKCEGNVSTALRLGGNSFWMECLGSFGGEVYTLLMIISYNALLKKYVAFAMENNASQAPYCLGEWEEETNSFQIYGTYIHHFHAVETAMRFTITILNENYWQYRFAISMDGENYTDMGMMNIRRSG